MGYQIQNVRRLSSEELLLRLIKAAKMYSEYADTELLFVFRNSKSSNYDFYEVRYGKNNFMHLAGIKSETKKALEFYEACLDGTVTKTDCTPRHSANNMYAKVSVMEQLLDLRHSKCYKIGEKNLVTRDNDFEMATGNNNGVIGYSARVSQAGSKVVDRTRFPIPTTLLNNSLTNYCSQPQKIMFILQKTDQENTYNTLFFEIKKGLLRKEYDGFPECIKERIARDIC